MFMCCCVVRIEMTKEKCNRSQGMNVDYGPNNDGKGCPVK